MIFKSLAIPMLALSLFLQSTIPSTAQTGVYARRCKEVEDDSPYNGYWWNADPSVCVPGIVSVETWYTPAPPYSQGAAVWYAPNVMEGTARYRQLSLEGYLDGVSLMSPSDIGRTVWLKRPGDTWEGPFLVVDCARRGDIYPVITTRGEIVEVGFQTAARWGMVYASQWEDGTYDRPYTVGEWKIEGVEVLKMDEIPDWIDDYDPIDYVQWWGDRAIFSAGDWNDTQRPTGLNPKYYPEFHPGWMWKGGEEQMPLGPYDDWFSILWGDDPLYKFDLPNNFETLSQKWRCIVDFNCSPGIQRY